MMLAFLDNGFFVFLVIALLSAVSDWISKRRAAKEEVEDSMPVPPGTVGREPRTGSSPAQGGQSRRRVPKLFEHLEQELKRLAEDSPIVEVLDTPTAPKEKPSESFGSQQRETFGVPDPLAAQKKKLAEAERLKKEAATKLANAKRLARRKKAAHSQKKAHGIPHVGVSTRNLKHWVRNSAQLRTAIALNTILETPKGLQNLSEENSERGF